MRRRIKQEAAVCAAAPLQRRGDGGGLYPPLEVIHLVVLIILAVIALILLLLLFTPLGVSADYDAAGVRAAVRVMWFDIQVFPRPQRPDKPGKEKAKKEKKPKKEKTAEKAEKEPKPPLVTKDMIPDLLRLALNTISRFRRKLTVNRFKLHITVGGDDPYDTVMTYGVINYAVATVGGAAGHAFNVKHSDVQTGVDFSAPSMSLEAGMTITINLARIIAVAAVAGVGFLKIKRRADRAAKAAAQERKENDGTDADPDGRVS